MLRPHLDGLLFEDSTGEDTGLMGDGVPAAKLGDPAVVREWALLEGRRLGGLVMAFASVRGTDRKETMIPITLSLRNQIKTKDASECLSKSLCTGNFYTGSIKVF